LIRIREGSRTLVHELFVEIRSLVPPSETLDGILWGNEELHNPQWCCWKVRHSLQQAGTLLEPTVRALEHRSLSALEEHASENVRRVIREHPVVPVSIRFGKKEREEGVDLDMDSATARRISSEHLANRRLASAWGAR
jgi:hypothetical protein